MAEQIKLAPQQITELNQAAQRVASNTPGGATSTNAGDVANLAYAKSRYGFVPSLNPTSQSQSPLNMAPGAAPQPSQPGQDPITKFNTTILDMLKSAQGASGQENLFSQATALQRAAAGRKSEITPEELRFLSPEQQAAIRGGKISALDPEIDAVSSAIKAQDARIQGFERILGTMREMGSEFAKLNPSPETIEGYKTYLLNGGAVSGIPQEIRDKVLGQMQDGDWMKASDRSFVAGLAMDFPDAGIMPNDTREQAMAKLSGSRIYSDKVRGPVGSRTITTNSPISRNTALGELQNIVNQLNLGQASIDNINPLFKGFIRISQQPVKDFLGQPTGEIQTSYIMNEPTDKQLVELANALGSQPIEQEPAAAVATSLPRQWPGVTSNDIQKTIAELRSEGDSKEQIVQKLVGTGFAQDVATRLVNINY